MYAREKGLKIFFNRIILIYVTNNKHGKWKSIQLCKLNHLGSFPKVLVTDSFANMQMKLRRITLSSQAAKAKKEFILK